jgi:hypothetical protein
MVNTDGENPFMEGMEKLFGILTGMAEELEDLAGSHGTSDGELEELNAGKTQVDSICHIRIKRYGR